MAPRPKPKYLEHQPAGQRERWQVSYTDFVTILLILFVAIAAQGLHSSETPRPPEVKQHLTNSQPAPKAKPLEVQQQTQAQEQSQAPQQPQPQQQTQSQQQPHAQPASNAEQQTVLDPALVQANEKLRSQGLDSHLEKRGLVISLPQAVLFPSGDDHVTAGALTVVSQIAAVLASVPNKVALVGHADAIPVHNKRFQSNFELAAARGVNLLEVLRSRYGIDESRLSVQSYGSNDPKDSNDTAAGRAENRRVEILLLDEPAR